MDLHLGRKVAALVEEGVARPHAWAWGCRIAIVGVDMLEGAVTYLVRAKDQSGTFKVYIPHRT